MYVCNPRFQPLPQRLFSSLPRLRSRRNAKKIWNYAKKKPPRRWFSSRSLESWTNYSFISFQLFIITMFDFYRMDLTFMFIYRLSKNILCFLYIYGDDIENFPNFSEVLKYHFYSEDKTRRSIHLKLQNLYFYKVIHLWHLWRDIYI